MNLHPNQKSAPKREELAMSENLTALIVENDPKWMKTLKEALDPHYHIQEARSLSEVNKIILENEKSDRKLDVALVDLVLHEEGEAKGTGLDVLFVLNKAKVPCIVATALDKASVMRDALVIGKAKDVWFKEEKLITLREKIDSILTRDKNSGTDERTLLITPSFQAGDQHRDPKLVFVLMPFNEKWSNDVLMLIKNAGAKYELEVLRADDIFEPHNIVNDIWQLINRAGLIIADITKHNANVFYELGIAHTIGKEVVLIREANGERPPFDISLWRYFDYELMPSKVEEFNDRLSKVFQSYCKKNKI